MPGALLDLVARREGSLLFAQLVKLLHRLLNFFIVAANDRVGDSKRIGGVSILGSKLGHSSFPLKSTILIAVSVRGRAHSGLADMNSRTLNPDLSIRVYTQSNKLLTKSLHGGDARA